MRRSTAVIPGVGVVLALVSPRIEDLGLLRRMTPQHNFKRLGSSNQGPNTSGNGIAMSHRTVFVVEVLCLQKFENGVICQVLMSTERARPWISCIQKRFRTSYSFDNGGYLDCGSWSTMLAEMVVAGLLVWRIAILVDLV